MTTCKDWSIFFIAAVLLVSDPVQATVKYQLTPRQIVPGERVRLEIRIPVSGLGDLEAHPPVVHDELLTKAEALRVLDQDYRRDGDDLVWTYQITGAHMGTLNVPPVEIQIGTQSFSTELQQIQMTSTRPPNDESSRDEFGAVSPPFRWGPYLKYIFLAMALGGIGLVIWWRRRKPRVKVIAPEPVLVEPEETALEWLRKTLAAIRRGLDSARSDEQALDEVTHALRGFFERTSRNPVEAWTTSEFRSRFSRDKTAQEIGRLLEKCDALKFGGLNSPQGARETAVYCLEETERLLLP